MILAWQHNVLEALKLIAFTLLVVLMLLLASQIGDTASRVLAQAEPTHYNEQFCYSDCGFGRQTTSSLGN